MTDRIFASIQELTGTQFVSGCPWRALRDPFVQRVIYAMPFFESGQLAFALPQPSARLVAGIRHYHHVTNRVWSKQMELEKQERARVRPLPMRGGHVRGR